MTTVHISTPGPVTTWAGYERRRFRISWGAVFAGLAVAAATHLIMTVLGIAVGSTLWDRGDQLESLGIGAVIWTFLTLLVALFSGGVTTGRLAGLLNRRDAVLHGIVLWSVFTMLMLWTVSSGIGGALGGAFQMFGPTAAAAAEEVRLGGSPETAAEELGVPVDSLKVAAQDLRRGVVRNQERITEVVSRGAWGMLGVLTLSILATMLGAAAGTPRVVTRVEAAPAPGTSGS